jgi:predicted CoA-binding protein
MNTLTDIQDFFKRKKWPLQEFQGMIKSSEPTYFKELKKKGFDVIPINPNTDEIYGEKCYRNVNDIPEGFQSVVVVTNKEQTAEVVSQCIDKKVKNVWIQQMSQTPEALDLIKDKNINLIANQCVMMFLEPVSGIHKFHGQIKKLFGKYPK